MDIDVTGIVFVVVSGKTVVVCSRLHAMQMYRLLKANPMFPLISRAGKTAATVMVSDSSAFTNGQSAGKINSSPLNET